MLTTSRRGFLQSTAAAFAAPAGTSLPTVRFGQYRVTRLIIGSNPFYGYSHFNRILDQLMREWYTQDRKLEVIRRCEQEGINTWQLHYSEQSMADFRRYRAEGGKMNWFLLGDGEMLTNLKLIPPAAKLQPIGIAHHGGRTDNHFRDGKMNIVRDFCKAVRDTGVLVGISTHNPAVVDFVEGAGWDVDYYMTCLYRVTRTREEVRKEFGEAPLGETFFEKDPERMTRMIRQTKKPCLAFKLLGAGRTIGSREQVEQAFRFALANIKPGDAAIVGMYPRFKDEVKENVEIVRKLTAGA